MIYLLDTNVCIAAMRGNLAVQHAMQSHSPHELAVSAVTLYELFSGVERCRQPKREREKIDHFLHLLHLLPYDGEAATHAAHLRWHLEQKGEMIGPYDVMLAGQALALDLILVTRNQREFRRAPGLKLEDWE